MKHVTNHRKGTHNIEIHKLTFYAENGSAFWITSVSLAKCYS